MENTTLKNIDSFNRKQLLVWLNHYPDFFGKQAKGLINFEELGKPGPNVPISPLNMEYLSGKDGEKDNRAYESHRRLMLALKYLYHNHPAMYDLIYTLYLADDAKPQLVDKWEKQWKNTGHSKARTNLGMRELALRKILEIVGDSHRLVVPFPLHKKNGKKSHKRDNRKVDGIRHYYDRMDMGASSKEAAQETSAQFGVTVRTVFNWVKSYT